MEEAATLRGWRIGRLFGIVLTTICLTRGCSPAVPTPQQIGVHCNPDHIAALLQAFPESLSVPVSATRRHCRVAPCAASATQTQIRRLLGHMHLAR